MEKIFLNKDKFSKEVEDTVKEFQISYIEAIIHLCEDKDIEVETIKKYINNVIKNKLEGEAREFNYLPYQNTLPGL